jgi:hypothetical protein
MMSDPVQDENEQRREYELLSIRSRLRQILVFGPLTYSVNEFEGGYIDCVEIFEGKVVLYDSRDYARGLSGTGTPAIFWHKPSQQPPETPP